VNSRKFANARAYFLWEATSPSIAWRIDIGYAQPLSALLPSKTAPSFMFLIASVDILKKGGLPVRSATFVRSVAVWPLREVAELEAKANAES
jgi:hypothetical protein